MSVHVEIEARGDLGRWSAEDQIVEREARKRAARRPVLLAGRSELRHGGFAAHRATPREARCDQGGRTDYVPLRWSGRDRRRRLREVERPLKGREELNAEVGSAAAGIGAAPMAASTRSALVKSAARWALSIRKET